MRVVVAPFALLPLLLACPDEVLVTPPGGVTGRVCNPLTGRVVEGARVFATFQTEGVGEQTKETASDPDGFFTLEGVGSGAQTVEVETEEFKDSFAVTIVSREIALIDNAACRDVPPEPGRGTIVGQICNRHVGEVLKDAQIFLTFADGTDNGGLDRTDPETGEFTIGVPTGSIVVTVIGNTFRKTYVVEVKEGDIVTVEQSADCGGAPLLTTGFITGTVCAPEEEGVPGGPLEGALVTASWQDGAGDTVEEVSTFTNAEGFFQLESLDPDDNITVRVVDDGGFAFTWNVTAGENGGPLLDRTQMPEGINLTAEVECQPLLPDDGRRYLVIQGIYDRIEDALVRNGIIPEIEPLPQGVEDWANGLFANQQRTSTYDAIFINCGAEDHELAVPGGLNAAARTGLRRYVEQGGVLYVADWSYEFVEQVFPERIDFFGPDTTFDGAQQAVGGTYSARVLDPDLELFLGRSEFDISFSFEAGSIISEVAEGTTIFLETDMQYAHDGQVDVLPNTPVTVGFCAGLGKVIFTSFHQEVNEGDAETLQGPEDEVLQYLILSAGSLDCNR